MHIVAEQDNNLITLNDCYLHSGDEKLCVPDELLEN